ncbi:hypothetical protein [Cytobacillus sp. BC1816]
MEFVLYNDENNFDGKLSASSSSAQPLRADQGASAFVLSALRPGNFLVK